MTEQHLEHSTLEGGYEGQSLSEAQLTDQQRLAVLLQAAALLAHLDHGRFVPTEDWSQARVTSEARLRIPGVRPGRSGELPQVVLRRLLQQLFRTDGTIEGRGEAKRAARFLSQRWFSILAPIQPALATLEVLDSAPFLWQPPFSEARRALVGVHHQEGEPRLWLIAPGHTRKRLLVPGTGRSELEELLASSDARSHWFAGDAEQDPENLIRRGRWRQAWQAWQAQGLLKGKRVISAARCLHALGRYSQVLDLIKDSRRRETRILRARCLYRLGEYGSAWNQISKLAQADLPTTQLLDATYLALRLAASRGQVDEGRAWVRRSLAQCQGPDRDGALLAAAESAWDRQAYDEMRSPLEEARGALDKPETAWRWHQVYGLYAMAKEDGHQAVEHLTEALRIGRRFLPLADAAGLWNDLAVARSYVDAPAAVERACRQAFLLYNRCEGLHVRMLALCNLAETRLRRGRLEGVEEVLETAMTENRRTGNIRAQIRDLELAIRLELARGRLRPALALYDEALAKFSSQLGDRLDIFKVLAARAYGWLDRRQQARTCLAPAGETDNGQPSPAIKRALLEMEPEERPALWARAGLWNFTRQEAAGTPWELLWKDLAHGNAPSSESWLAVSNLEPFRASRLIFDIETLQPGAVPPGKLRKAAEVLRRSGANGLADRIDLGSAKLWNALENYLKLPQRQPRDIEDLLHRIGYSEIKLSWVHGGHQEVLISGPGGHAESTAPCQGGQLSLQAPFIDPVLKTLFCLIRQDVKKPTASSGSSPYRPRNGIIGESQALEKALDRLDRLSHGELPVLLLGESGSGKELFARRVHQQSPRGDQPYLVVNCAALSESLILSDLFGHVRGAFTGADKDHKGVFESARGGTLFLDEIGDLPASAQGKLLRVLQENEIRRVGESFTRKVDVRVVAATHRDLEQMVRDNSFRQDLFFRLKVATVKLPALRERGRDALLLANHFLEQSSQKSARPSFSLSPEAEKHLLSYSWPGNIRELRNVLEVAGALAGGSIIQPEHLDLPVHEQKEIGDYHRKVKAYRRELILEALRQSNRNRSQAARTLGLTRQALSYLIRELDIDV